MKTSRAAVALFSLATIAAAPVAGASASTNGDSPAPSSAPASAAKATPLGTAQGAAAAAWPAGCSIQLTRRDPQRNLGLVFWSPKKVDFYGWWQGFTAKPKAMTLYVAKAVALSTYKIWYAVDVPTGKLYMLSELDTYDVMSGGINTLVDVKSVAKGFGGTRHLLASKPFLYQVTKSGALVRFRLEGKGPTVTLRSKGFANLRSLSPIGRVGTEDVFIGNTAAGSLIEFRVKRDSSKKIRTAVLAKTGWGRYAHVTAGACSGKGRPIIGSDTRGIATIYLDANGTDRSGRDIRKMGTDTGWTGTFFD